MQLSIIIPYYKTLDLTKKLLDKLIPQLTDEVEVILVDDGCNQVELDEYPITIVHLPINSGNASKPRNVGLDLAQGKYITFIDSDDMVSEDYIQKILNKIRKEPDIIYLSWKTKQYTIFISNKPPKWNCAVWCRVYKKELIGEHRFENIDIGEDYVFNLYIKPKTSLTIRLPIYYYNQGRKGSLLRRREK